MNGNTSLFAMKNKQFFVNTPYFKVDIDINNNINSTITVGLVVNSLTGQVNLTKLFLELQNGVNNNKKNFMDWRYLMDTMKYVDCYSLMKYGHVHYYYENKPIYDIKDVSEMINSKQLKILPELTNKGKVVKTSLISEAEEIYGEIYNGYPNECKGQYGDYHLITKMMSYISINYEIINNEFVSFIIPVLSDKSSTMIEEINRQENKIMIALDNGIPENSIIKKNIFDDKNLSEILSINNSTKGKLAENWTLNYMKKWFPDIKSCADIPESCDLISDSAGIRVEVKCRYDSEKRKNGICKFHRDVNKHENDTKLFIYLDLCRTSLIKTHIEINPLRLYINGNDLSDDLMNFVSETCLNLNNLHVAEYSGNINSNILVKSTKQMFDEMLAELKNQFKPTLETLINEYVSSSNGEETSSENLVKNKTRVEKYMNTVKEFVCDNIDKFNTGYYVTKSYDLYVNWCRENKKQNIMKKEFNTIMKTLCENRRILTDPYTNTKNNLHYWIAKMV